MTHQKPIFRAVVSNVDNPDLIHLSAGGIIWMSTELGQVEIKNLSDTPVFVGSVSLSSPPHDNDRSVYDAAE